MHIHLIGSMCAGKSRVGRELALLLQLPFLDLDRVIEQRVGAIKPFFEREGEEAFRAIEAVVLNELIQGPRAVIATGGGTPCSGDNLQRMVDTGTVVWLDVPLAVLMPRIIRAGGDRPLLAGLKGDALQQRVESLLAERRPIYAKADVAVDGSGTPQQVADLIRSALDQVR